LTIFLFGHVYFYTPTFYDESAEMSQVVHLWRKKNLAMAELFYSRKKKSLFAKELLTSWLEKKSREG